MEGTYDERVFDQRELKFEIGDGESFGLPAGMEKCIMAMEQGEEALFTIKSKYDGVYYHTFTLFNVKSCQSCPE